MKKSNIVYAIIALSVGCGLLSCKRADPSAVDVKPAAEAAKPTPADDKSPQYVKDLRKDEQKASDVGAIEQKAAETEAKATEDATK